METRYTIDDYKTWRKDMQKQYGRIIYAHLQIRSNRHIGAKMGKDINPNTGRQTSRNALHNQGTYMQGPRVSLRFDGRMAGYRFWTLRSSWIDSTGAERNGSTLSIEGLVEAGIVGPKYARESITPGN